MIKKNYLRRRD